MWDRYIDWDRGRYRILPYETEEDRRIRKESEMKISVDNTKSSKKYDRAKFRGR